MAWLVVDSDKTELKFDMLPIRFGYVWKAITKPVILPNGTIEKLIGRKLTWSSKPVKIKEK